MSDEEENDEEIVLNDEVWIVVLLTQGFVI